MSGHDLGFDSIDVARRRSLSSALAAVLAAGGIRSAAGPACRRASGGGFQVSPRYRCARRRTGVKIAAGAARDVVVTWCGRGRKWAWRWEPVFKGRFIVAASTRVSFFRSPRFPGGISWQVGEGRGGAQMEEIGRASCRERGESAGG